MNNEVKIDKFSFYLKCYVLFGTFGVQVGGLIAAIGVTISLLAEQGTLTISPSVGDFFMWSGGILALITAFKRRRYLPFLNGCILTTASLKDIYV